MTLPRAVKWKLRSRRLMQQRGKSHMTQTERANSQRNRTEDADALLDSDGTADVIGVRPKTLESWRTRNIGPKFIRLSRRCVRYRLADIKEYLAKHTIDTD